MQRYTIPPQAPRSLQKTGLWPGPTIPPRSLKTARSLSPEDSGRETRFWAYPSSMTSSRRDSACTPPWYSPGPVTRRQSCPVARCSSLAASPRALLFWGYRSSTNGHPCPSRSLSRRRDLLAPGSLCPRGWRRPSPKYLPNQLLKRSEDSARLRAPKAVEST